MRTGLALPQYDYSVPGDSPLRFETLARYAAQADAWGYDSLWLSDHLFLDLAKYGGTGQRYGAFEPIATLGALVGVAPTARLGTLVLCEALRHPVVAAKALATLDRVSGGRLDVGLGAGWYEPEYEAIGMAMPAAGTRIDRLIDAVEVVKGLLDGGPFVYAGEHHCARGARNLPAAVQRPRPRVFIGGKGDRVLRTVARHADGWNTCWVWTVDEYRDRVRVLDAACEKNGRDPATVWRTLGLYALCGENDKDLADRFERLRRASPPGVLDAVSLEEYRRGRLVGTVEQVREQIVDWEAAGVDTLVLGAGAVPFQVSAPDDVEALMHACVKG